MTQFEIECRSGEHSVTKKFLTVLDYFRPYKNQVETGYKGHPIEFMVDFFRPFRTFWDY